MSALRPNHREKAAPKSGAANGLIDPTKTGKYPVILSDTLLGRTQKEVFTAVRYNHKPELTSEPGTARLKPETPGSKSDFDLSFPDGNNGMYGYAGTRTMDDNQYVLYFDPARKVFILDKVDSTFHMNVTRTPSNDNPESLRQQFEQLDTSITATPEVRKPTAAADSKDKPSTKPAAKASSGPKRPSASSNKAAAKPRKPAAAKKSEPIHLALPTNDAPPVPAKPTAPAKKKETTRKAAGSDDEEDDDDDDFGLTIEYPDEHKNKKADFSPAFAPNIQVRSFSDFLRDSEADDADGESDLEERDLANFNLPSPMNGQAQQQEHQQHHHFHNDQYQDQDDDAEQMEVDSEPDFEDALEDDLEAELEKELEAANSGDAEESEVSEED
ncbi:RNA polymerase II transcription elongation factor-domain-containing protein [Colletotrichum navitas]|uniref:RNA polymerase II transcription elongation factor-domain-containing protein n=1 Tax=Colletotrichum navitas TaxID=681940 RepID=A0AAD8V3J3_9PEZI|nr:RNA polymerase II transcription elongation factor-domain-containing protein [Colletotrichum navitas]KAK1590880.1 RNA polymerase II transcription elongation factor-domain-containing protein [Colletotrichum navitas]